MGAASSTITDETRAALSEATRRALDALPEATQQELAARVERVVTSRNNIAPSPALVGPALALALLADLRTSTAKPSLPVRPHAKRLNSGHRGLSRKFLAAIRELYGGLSALDKAMADVCKEAGFDNSVCALTRCTGLSLAESIVHVGGGREGIDALVGKADEEDAGDAGGAYRPPKMVPTAMDDFEEGGKSAKQKRKEKEARRRASRSALIKVRRFSRHSRRLRDAFFFLFFDRTRLARFSRANATRATQLPRSSARFRRRRCSMEIEGDHISWHRAHVPNLGQGTALHAVGDYPIKSWTVFLFFSFLFPSARRARRFDVPSRDPCSPYRTTSHLFRYTLHP